MKTKSKTLAVLTVAAISVLPALHATADTVSPPAFGEPGTTVRVSVGTNGEQLTYESGAGSISSDGHYVGFFAYDAPRRRHELRIYDPLSSMSHVVSAAVEASPTSFSADGNLLAFTSESRKIILYDQRNGTRKIVSVNSGGEPADADSTWPSISANGHYVAFHSDANNLTPGDSNDASDIFVRDRVSKATEWLSMNANGTPAAINEGSYQPSISADGSAVAFWSASPDLVPGDTNGQPDIFVRVRASGKTERVNVSSDGFPATSYTQIASQSIDATGRRIVFTSDSANLVEGDTNDTWDLFVHDRKTGETRRVNVDSNGAQQDYGGADPSISVNGRYVVFASYSSKLAPPDRNRTWDVFVHDLLTGKTTRESVDPLGREATNDNNDPYSNDPSVSADGRYLVFGSRADNLVEGDTNRTVDIFVRTRHTLAYTNLAAMADVDGNGAPELAALRVLADGDVEVIVKDSVTKALVSTLAFPNSDRMIRGLASLPDIAGDGSPEVAVLFRRHDGHGIVAVRDVVSGAEFPELHFFGKDWESRAITGFDANRDGVPDIAVLALKDDMSEARVQIRDAVNQVLVSSVRLPAAPGDAYAGLTALPDMNGNGVPEVAALRVLPGGKQEVIIKDSESGERIRTVNFNVTDMQAAGLAAVRNGTAPAVAVLFRKSVGQGKVQVRNAMTGEYVRTLTFAGGEWNASAVASFDANSDGVTDIGVLAVKDNGSGVSAQVRDAVSTEQLNWVDFPADDR